MVRERHAAATSSSPIDNGTVIGPDIRVSGRVTGEEDLHVEGRVDGAIALSETLFVAPGGIVAATVEAHNIVVSGVLLGNVTARDCVTLHPGAKLVGDINAPRLVIADGATFKGNVRMGGEAPPAREPARNAARARNLAGARRPTPTPRPAVAANDRRPPPRQPKPAETKPETPAPVDDEPTVIVRHSAIADDDAPRGRSREEAAPARAAKAPPGAARGEGTSKTS
ncbi:MAG TPA: polymer-forming cytoskeletal protein, partial [Nannocystaceae bacterium]|nr:polymer-forming cytoskeletal protein [Nannocystaceae bacterium]